MTEEFHGTNDLHRRKLWGAAAVAGRVEDLAIKVTLADKNQKFIRNCWVCTSRPPPHHHLHLHLHCPDCSPGGVVANSQEGALTTPLSYKMRNAMFISREIIGSINTLFSKQPFTAYQQFNEVFFLVFIGLLNPKPTQNNWVLQCSCIFIKLNATATMFIHILQCSVYVRGSCL